MNGFKRDSRGFSIANHAQSGALRSEGYGQDEAIPEVEVSAHCSLRKGSKN